MAKNRRRKVKGNRRGEARSGRRNTYKKYKNKLNPAPEYKPYVIDWSSPGGRRTANINVEDIEACKERVANGMKCYCLEVCHCRDCDGCKTLEYPDECVIGCKNCSNHKPCS